MPVRGIANRHELGHHVNHVAANVRIRVLIDGQAGSRMRAVHGAHAFLNAGPTDDSSDIGRNVDELLRHVRLYVQLGLHLLSSYSPYRIAAIIRLDVRAYFGPGKVPVSRMSDVTRVSDIEIGSMRAEESGWAAAMAARALCDNPVSVAVFGGVPAARLKALDTTFQLTLSYQRRPPLVARRNGTIVGLAAVAPPDECLVRQMAARQKTVTVGKKSLGFSIPAIPKELILPMMRLGPATLGRISTWSEVIFTHDPEKQHQHVELVAVEPSLQGLGIGRLLMTEACRTMESLPGMPYLETDTPENVRFYESFGFEVLGEAGVLGATNWFMGRPTSD